VVALIEAIGEQYSAGKAEQASADSDTAGRSISTPIESHGVTGHVRAREAPRPDSSERKKSADRLTQRANEERDDGGVENTLPMAKSKVVENRLLDRQTARGSPVHVRARRSESVVTNGP